MVDTSENNSPDYGNTKNNSTISMFKSGLWRHLLNKRNNMSREKTLNSLERVKKTFKDELNDYDEFVKRKEYYA